MQPLPFLDTVKRGLPLVELPHWSLLVPLSGSTTGTVSEMQVADAGTPRAVKPSLAVPPRPSGIVLGH